MFYYFGRKGRLAGKYPAPEHPLVIEPFAGSAAYTLHHRPERALLIERDQRVVDLWNRLCAMGPEGLAAAEPPVIGERTSDLWHLTSMASKDSLTVSGYKVSPWALASWELARKVALRHVEYASTIEYVNGSYVDAPDVVATWFIDPPYQHVPSGYLHGSRGFDYGALAEFCRTRRGQVIVCEQEGADWLPFEPFTSQQNVQSTGRSHEVWWTNQSIS